MIPNSSTEVSTYFPPSLGNLEPRPTFRFRPPSPRSKRRYSHALVSEGLRYHSPESLENETIRAMRELWVGDDDTLVANETRLRGFWETLRQAQKDPTIVIDPQEAEAIMLAVTRLTDAWPMLRQMNADNLQFNEDAPKIALGMFLAGWSDIDVPFRLEDGRVPLETLDALETAIGKIETKARQDKVEGVIGIAFTQLALHALGLMNLAQDAEKNSPSPSSPSDSPDGSTADGSEATDSAGASESSSSDLEKSPA